jgi:AAA family ATP:ADP antiporter
MKQLKPDEVRVAIWAIIYYFCLMCSYYIIKPIRDEMGIISGVNNLQLLFTGTFLVMLLVIPVFGWVTSRYPREKFLPYVYLFFIFNILVFFFLFRAVATPAYVARVFYIWTSVYNLFVVSVFWSFMAEIFSAKQARRLFAVIAAGGTTGGIIGPGLTTFLVPKLGTENLLPVSVAFLGVALLSMYKLHRWHAQSRSNRGQAAARLEPALKVADQTMHGGMLAGVRQVISSPYLLGICLLVLLYTTLSTFLYFQQLTIVERAFDDSAKRTALFGIIELFTNSLTLLFQFVLTRHIVNRYGVARMLALIPVLLCFGFLVLGMAPVLGVIVTLQVIRRAGNYSITRPVREMLYVVLSKEEKYKAKNFIDTAVYRGGDMLSAWAYAGMNSGLGLGLSAIALIAVPISGIWAVTAYRLGKVQERLSAE